LQRGSATPGRHVHPYAQWRRRQRLIDSGARAEIKEIRRGEDSPASFADNAAFDFIDGHSLLLLVRK
jgi:hypothetical protein